jgi:hypothetical protein
MGRLILFSSVATALLALAACEPAPRPASTSEAEEPATTAIVWPSGFVVLGDGFPKAGDPCRRLGESAQTVDYLDDSAILVGCAGDDGDVAAKAVAKAAGGQVLVRVNGVTMITIPQGDANVGMATVNKTTKTTKGSVTE